MELYPNKSQYMVGESVRLFLRTENAEQDPYQIRIMHLDEVIMTRTICAEEEETGIDLDDRDFSVGGYGVDLIKEERVLCHTAFDVVEDPFESLRYGFLSDFEEKDMENGALEWMRRCHINLVQFYDWSYRHDHLVSDEAFYTDMMGKPIFREAVCQKIQKAGKYGMKTMAYGAVYAASKAFYEEHPRWALFYPDGEPITFIDVFYIMNIQEESPWREHLIGQYKEAITQMGFSGIHMDTYGEPKTAKAHLKDSPEAVYLEEAFPGLIHDTYESLKESMQDPCLVFNNVGNWPVDQTADTDQKAVYVEVWSPYDRYEHIAKIIREARAFCKDQKPVILAAYLASFRLESIERGIRAARLLLAGIISNGAYNLLTGENQAILTQGYYSDYTKLDRNAANVICAYYDFMIRYKELFYDKCLSDVSMTHFGGDNLEYTTHCDRVDVTPKAGKIWLIIRQSKSKRVLSLINLCGNDDLWNQGKEEPETIQNIDFSVQINESLEGIYMASPDAEDQGMKAVDYQVKDEKQGRFVTFAIPKLTYWTIIEIRGKER
ncbi:MAG: glycoside hydrolase family 66 protein [Lachnospiraceae bacterium]|nr:glycoside hydrolase family 66 protein [Lachnospiraceae bacterium]